MSAELVQLEPQTQFAAFPVDRWSVVKKLGEGGFGAVYKVADASGEYALKVEAVNEECQVLKMEVFVLQELGKRGGRHFCKIYDKGRFGTFNFVVMTLVGESLQDLRKAGPQGRMSLGTAVSVGIQALEALEDLHSIGYLHRDVKPGNYTIGRRERAELRKVYVLDFGLCRKYTNEQAVIRKPRQAAGFRGTVRYAPISCHLERELSRKDDLETWLYMLVELTTGTLPWRSITDPHQVGEFKKRCRSQPYVAELFAGCPAVYESVLRLIDNYRYYDAPNYQQIYGMLRQVFQLPNVTEFPYDWEQ